MKMFFDGPAPHNAEKYVKWMTFFEEDDEDEDGDDGYELIAEEDIGAVNRLCQSWKGLRVMHGHRPKM